MFTGRNILTGFPTELTMVVNFLNEKAAMAEFEFNDSVSYWEDNKDIIRPLGLQFDGANFYFAVALAYIAHLNDGSFTFIEGAHVRRWAWSLNTIAAFGGWAPVFMEKVMLSFSKNEEDIDGLMNTAAHTYGRTNYDNGLILMDKIPKYRVSIMAGLMENDYARYCKEFSPEKNSEEFANIFFQTYQLENGNMNDAFDKAIGFSSFSSSMAMAFFLKIYGCLDERRKNVCEAKVKELLSNRNTIEYVKPVTDWAYFLSEHTAFLEDCILMLVRGLGKVNSNFLSSVDNALALHHARKEFLAKLIICVAENLEPTDVLKLEKCLHCFSKNKEDFLNMVQSFILHSNGMYRIVGRTLWDEYYLDVSDFNANNLDETLQIRFIVSMLQDYGNPERRLPKLLPLLTEGSNKIRSVLMYFIQPYVDEYMGHVTHALDVLNIDCDEAKAIRAYVDKRGDYIKVRREMKELSPQYTSENVFREAVRQQNRHLQVQMKEAEASHKSTWKDFVTTVVLARGGGWRDESGHTQHLPLTTFSMPSRIMAESMSPKEQDEWWDQLMKDWNDTTGDN